MSNQDSRNFLDAVSDYSASKAGTTSSADKPVLIGTIDPYYTAGQPKVLLDGESVTSSKGYAWVSAYTPMAGDRVFIIPVGQSYVIGGKIQSTSAVPRYFDLSLTSGWVNYDASFYHGGTFTKTASGVVKLAGLIKNGTINNDTLIATLPAGFRPSSRMVFPTMTNGTAGTVYVDVNGDVRVKQWARAEWLSLDNVTFPTENLQWITPTLLNSFTPATDLSVGPPQYATDAYNRIWFRGGVERATPTADNTAMFMLNTTFASEYHITASTLGGVNNFGFVGIFTNGQVSWKMGSTSGSIQLGGVMTPTQSSTPWTAVTFQNSWKNYSTPAYTGASYHKDADGVVHLRGLINSGVMGQVMFSLPAGFRPEKAILREVVSAGALGRLDINNNGSVSALLGSNVWISLDGVNYPAMV